MNLAVGRPRKGVLSSYSSRLPELIKKIRSEEPGFGALSILTELRITYGYEQSNLPSESSIAAFLRQQGMVNAYEKHSKLPSEACLSATRPHELWQIDGRGNEHVKGVGPIALLDIKDDFSAVYVSCFPSLMESMQGHPNTESYQMALRYGFHTFGLPEQVQCDHASVFHDNHSKSPFPTRFHLWLVGLGIKLLYSRVHQPTDQAKVERAHQTLYNQTVKSRDPYRDWEHFFAKCQARLHVLNNEFPSQSTNGLPPLRCYPEALHSGREYSAQEEANLLDMDRVWQYLANCKWYRKVASNKTVSLGGQVYYIANAKPREQLVIVFCSRCQFLLFQNSEDVLINIAPVKGIDKSSLIGKLDDFFKVPYLQLKIPFNWQERVCTNFLESGLV
jgi:transposase InsO family protein